MFNSIFISIYMGRKNCGQHYGGIGEMTKFIIVVFLVLSAFIVFTIPYRHRYKRKLSKKNINYGAYMELACSLWIGYPKDFSKYRG